MYNNATTGLTDQSIDLSRIDATRPALDIGARILHHKLGDATRKLPMRKVLSGLAVIIALYLVLSLAASLAVAVAPDWAYDVVTHRAPLTIAEIATVTVQPPRDGVTAWGMTADGLYLAYAADYAPGTTVTTLMVYHPLTNWCDDIVWRLDIPHA
jgi:hypothetical protein